ncbi:hypothetical protein [uncultured Marixanthomonas sp.]|uniref:hypothetical protein n=1 Tax=uncultured Marixanthomonas sp. TaxID=757245 RepID=UPI0030DB2C10|tara:strand:- start:173653 stop:174348 length:696 start_codon:yes stop_codon:yes gene_type:complete
MALNIKFTTLSFLLLCAYTLNAQKTYELSKLLNGVGLNTVISQSKDYKVQERVKNEDTLRGYALNNDSFTFLGNPIGQIEVHETNGMVQFIGFVIEEKQLDGSHIFDDIDKTIETESDEIMEGASEVDTTDPTAISEVSEAENKKRNNRKQAFVNFVNKNSPITQQARAYLNENFEFVSSEPLCQFNCWDKWRSDYAEIGIEKNNFIEDVADGKEAVYIEQTLIIKTNLNN